jgi:hypothetical protein
MGVYKFSDASSLATDKISYKSMLAGNTTWIDWEPGGAFDALGTVTVGSTSLASDRKSTRLNSSHLDTHF